MGVFDLFKKQKKIQDEFFGRLTLISFNDSTKDFFVGKGKFGLAGDEIDYTIDADLSGPTIDQRNFYNKVQDLYEEIVLKIIPLIEDEFKNWNEDFKIKNFKKEFKLVAVTIPRLNSKLTVWEMSFETIHDNNHQVTIDFNDFEPRKALLGG